jgi:outer membrane lipoprotein-sorting protein
MTRFVFLFLLSAALARAEPAPLAPAQAQALRIRFETRQRATRSWSAAFTQTLTMPGLRAAVVSDGTLRFHAPGDLRIEFTKPAGELVLILGDRLFLRKPGKRVVEKSVASDSAGKPFQALLSLLQGRPPENEEQFEPRVTAEDGRYVITLTKKADAPGKLPKRITNIVSEATLDVAEVLVELPNGGSLRYVFRDPARNRPVDAALFAPPAD